MIDKVRVHEIATELGIKSKEVVDKAAEMGIDVKTASSSVSMEEAEQLTIDFISQYCEPGTAPICGNSVWFDRLYLDKDMPDLAKLFHYRVIDVSSFKTVLNMWDKRSIAFPKTKSLPGIAFLTFSGTGFFASLAKAIAAAIFISSLIYLALTSKVALNKNGKHITLLI